MSETRPSRRIAAVGGLLLLPALLPDSLLQGLLIPAAILGMAALGLRMLMAEAGQMSLASAAYMAVGAFSAWNLVHRIEGMPVLLAVMCGGLIAAVISIAFVLPSVRVKGFYAVLATLAAQFFLSWLFARVGWFVDYAPTGFVATQPLTFFGMTLGSPSALALVVLIFAIALHHIACNLDAAQTGRLWRAQRDDADAAERAGLPVAALRLQAFAVSGLCCGIAGALAAYCHLGSLQGGWFSLDLSFRILFMALLGGTMTRGGPFLGAAFVIALPGMIQLVLQWPLSLLGIALSTDRIAALEQVVLGAAAIYVLTRRATGLARISELAAEVTAVGVKRLTRKTQGGTRA